MPGLVLLVAAVVVNYTQHRRHRPTICQVVRRTLPARIAGGLLLAGFSWLLPHVLRGYPRPSKETLL